MNIGDIERAKYVTLDIEHAVDEGLIPEHWKSPWCEYQAAVLSIIDGEVKVLGTDGGEPEDNTLYRDWSWIAPELENAYKLGLQHGIAMVKES